MTKFITLFAFTLLSFTITAQQSTKFFAEVDAFLSQHVVDGKVDYAAVKQDPRLTRFVQDIAQFDYTKLGRKEQKAYLINVYNLLVIDKIVEAYPIASVQESGTFFTRETITVAGVKTSLTEFEKEQILKPFGDGRLHFVLVCGAIGCPPITNFAYTPENLNAKLDAQTKKALNDPSFISVEGNQINISKIFEWYSTDFGVNKTARVNFINKYRTKRISSSAKFRYLDYDWSINDTAAAANINVDGNKAANSARYVTSSTIPKGTVELRLFNNLFTQRFEDGETTSANRGNFFTTTVSGLYGVNKRFNAGIEFKYRRVSNSTFPSSVFTVFGNDDDPDVFNTRARITGIGPKIRWAPTAALPNFSIQSTLQFPVGDELQGNFDENLPFIDWQGAVWNTQFFNDISIGTRFSFFTEIDLFFEDLGSEEEGRTNRFSTPATIIFSYFPNPNTTIYTIGNYAPIFTEDFDYFYQYGLGFKYQFSRSFELELIVTEFTTKFTADNDGQAATFNFGLRYNIQ